MKRIVVTSGYFNPVHVGHLNLLKEAKALGDFLVVIVNNDAQVKLKGSMPFMSELERIEILSNIKHVDTVFLSIDQDKSVAQSLAKIALQYPGHKLFFAKGGDRGTHNIPEAEKAVCEQYGIEVANNVGGGKVQSSSQLINNVIHNSN